MLMMTFVMNVLDPKVHKTDPMLGPACWRCLTYRWSCRGFVRIAWVRVIADWSLLPGLSWS